MKNLHVIFRIVALIIGVSFFISCDRSNDDKVEPVFSKIAKPTKLYSNITLENGKTNTKYYSEEVGNAVPGQKVKILELGGWEKFKIELPDGAIGWIKSEFLEPEKNTFIKYNTSGDNRHIASNRGAVGSARKIVKEVNEKTAVTRLEEYREVKSSGYTIDWTRVRTEDGIEGWIMSDYLFRVVMDPVRYINRKEWHYTMDGFKKKWIGKPIEKLVKKYKEPGAVKISGDENIFYFNNIYLLYDNYNLITTRVHTDLEGNVKDVDSGIRKRNWASYMPLSNLAKINFLSNYVGNWQYIGEKETDINKKSWSFFDHFPGWIAWILVIIIFLIMLAFLYGVLWVPFYLMNKWTFKQSLNRKLFNKRIKLYAILTSIIIGYIYYLLMVVNFYPFNNYFFITTLFCWGMITGNIYRWRNRLDYNRCDSAECHQWTGQDNGTEFLGGLTETQNIRYSNGATEKNTRTTRHYRDHRICTACGNRWSIKRTEVLGGLKV